MSMGSQPYPETNERLPDGVLRRAAPPPEILPGDPAPEPRPAVTVPAVTARDLAYLARASEVYLDSLPEPSESSGQTD